MQYVTRHEEYSNRPVTHKLRFGGVSRVAGRTIIFLVVIFAVSTIKVRASDSDSIAFHVINRTSDLFHFNFNRLKHSLRPGIDTIFHFRVDSVHIPIRVEFKPDEYQRLRLKFKFFEILLVDDKDRVFEIGPDDVVSMKCAPEEQLFQDYERRRAYPGIIQYSVEQIKKYPDHLSSAMILLVQFGDARTSDSMTRAVLRMLGPNAKQSMPARQVKEYLERHSALNAGNRFEFGTLHDTAGVEFSAQSLHSHYILVDFWFTACQLCREAFPGLDSLYKVTSRSDLEVVAISTDWPETWQNWKKYLVAASWPWINVNDSKSKTAFRYAITIFPTRLLLDRNFVILKINPTPADIIATVNSK